MGFGVGDPPTLRRQSFGGSVDLDAEEASGDLCAVFGENLFTSTDTDTESCRGPMRTLFAIGALLP